MDRLVLDTNVYIRAIRDEKIRSELAAWQRRMAPRIHQHSVVIAELLVGAGDEVTRRRWYRAWVQPAERVRRIIVPEYGTWLRASRIVSLLAMRGRLDRRSVGPGFFNDCLLAATARENGHRIVTYDRAHFELIAEIEPAAEPMQPLT